jgi:hypothetical protein
MILFYFIFWNHLMSTSLLEVFSSIEDPRVDRHKRHKLTDIIVLTICAVISGAEGWEAIEQFGITKREWLQKWDSFA